MVNIFFGLPPELQDIICSFYNFYKEQYTKNVIKILEKNLKYKKTYKTIFDAVLFNIKIYTHIKNKRIKYVDRTFFYIDNFRFSKYDSSCGLKCSYAKCSDIIFKPHYHFYCLKKKVHLKIYSKDITFYKGLILFNNYCKNI